MGTLKDFIRKTPLIRAWRFAKKKPPLKQMRSLAGKWHRYYMLKIKLPGIYRKYARKPVDEKKVVFFEVRLAELTNSFQTLYKAVTAMNTFDVHTHFLRLTFVSRKQYDRNCVEFVKDIATAKYIFADEASNVLSCVPMRPETIVTQTWHGCGAFKKFGFSTADLIFGLNREQQLKYPFYKNYTYVTLSSPEVAWAYEEAMNLSDRPEILKATGISRTDVFFDEKFIANAFEKLHFRLIYDSKAETTGLTDCKDQSITMKYQSDAIYHELGHFLAFITGNADYTSEWQNIYCAEKSKYTKFNKGYVCSNQYEYFAESYKEYILDRATLRARRPRTYKYIVNTVKNANAKNAVSGYWEKTRQVWVSAGIWKR